jgi:hypothetical protein
MHGIDYVDHAARARALINYSKHRCVNIVLKPRMLWATAQQRQLHSLGLSPRKVSAV